MNGSLLFVTGLIPKSLLVLNETICALLQAKAAVSKALYASVTEQYSVLKSAIHGNQGLDASNSVVSLSQPWK